jgi:PAS domain S-box-containing protein
MMSPRHSSSSVGGWRTKSHVRVRRSEPAEPAMRRSPGRIDLGRGSCNCVSSPSEIWRSVEGVPILGAVPPQTVSVRESASDLAPVELVDPVDPAFDRVPAAERRVLDALGVAVYTTDPEGRLTYFNDAAVGLWGRRPELGELWCGSWKLVWPDGRPMPHDACPMAICLREGRPVRGGVAIAERPDGSRVVFESLPSPLLDIDGVLTGCVNVLLDVTERHNAEEALASTAEALALSSAARDDFLGLVSHELRTPVTTIYGNARLLLQRLDRLPDLEVDMVGDIAADAERLLAIVENLLLMSRLQAGVAPDLEPQLLGHVVEREVATFRQRRPKRDISFKAAGRHVVIEADRAYITLLIQNLLSNADKYGGHGRIEVILEDDAMEVRVKVLDRGLGIDGVNAEDLFTPFYRTKEAQKVAGGVGLGLPVCRRIVEAMGGRIWASPRDGGGSEFGFALPVSLEPSNE